jgi:hypothetical protein
MLQIHMIHGFNLQSASHGVSCERHRFRTELLAVNYNRRRPRLKQSRQNCVWNIIVFVVLSGGLPSTLSGGLPSTLSGGLPSTLSGGLPSILSGGLPSTLSGGLPSTLSGGLPSTLSGGLPSTQSQTYASLH